MAVEFNTQIVNADSWPCWVLVSFQPVDHLGESLTLLFPNTTRTNTRLSCVPPSPPLPHFLPSHFSAKWDPKWRWLPQKRLRPDARTWNVTHTKVAHEQRACIWTYNTCTDTCLCTFTRTFSPSASLLSWHVASTQHRVGSRLSGTLYHSPSLCHYISLGITPSLCQIYSVLHRLYHFFYWVPSRPEGSLSSSKKSRPVYHGGVMSD